MNKPTVSTYSWNHLWWGGPHRLQDEHQRAPRQLLLREVQLPEQPQHHLLRLCQQLLLANQNPGKSPHHSLLVCSSILPLSCHACFWHDDQKWHTVRKKDTTKISPPVPVTNTNETNAINVIGIQLCRPEHCMSKTWASNCCLNCRWGRNHTRCFFVWDGSWWWFFKWWLSVTIPFAV